MQLAPVDAQRFIQGYKLLMLEVLGEREDHITGSVVPLLAKARAKLVGKPALLRQAIAQLEARQAKLDCGVVMALEGLEVRQWVYLRDTKLHSIMIDWNADRAFGVLGLTQGLRDLIGGTGVIIEAGLVRYCGRYVCDGIISQVVWLGPGYRRSWNETFKEIKASGQFHAKADV
ncbi:MAG TPA: hypothetical protein PKD12_02665 [Nitrospira sp.]|nr:hypothetical protein [Nitrospira sp.]